MLTTTVREPFLSKPGDMVIKADPNTLFGKQDSLVIPPKTLSSIYRSKVIDAYRDRRIFTVFGNYSTIRHSLLKRGWLEKLPPGRFANLQNLPEEVLLQHAKRGNDYESVVISKIINHFPAFFIWQAKFQRDLYGDVRPYRNRVRRSHAMDFATKIGLIGCAEYQHWFREEGVAGMNFPRFFRLGTNQEEQQAFIDDFRMTQCRSLLRYIVQHVDKQEQIAEFDTGTICPTIIHFALDRVKRQLDDWENNCCLDVEQSQIPDDEWVHFLEKSSLVIHRKNKIKCTYRELTDYIKTAKNLLSRTEVKHPEYKWDGCKNIWILKPGFQCRGEGVIVRNNLNEILNWSSSHYNSRYIVQKYIEQPLLIYRTKFDIRLYMILFIRESTVQLWLYPDCYFKICSQEYNVDDLREVLHVSNFTVQKRYKNKALDHRLPKCNMWSLEQFKSYLKSQDVPEDIWDRRIFPGIRENIIAVVLCSLDDTNLTENSFELYGCDFMLDEEYNPVLIEVNATPDMSASTEVTARLCPKVMQDLIKVIVDLPRNNRASTGQFRLVYEVNYKFKQEFNFKEGLNVNGKAMELCKRSGLHDKPKCLRKSKHEHSNTINKLQNKRSHLEKTSNKSLPKSSKSKIVEPNSSSKSLKAVAKQALAVRYTMPK